jgi:hypothetical protein
MAMGCGGMTGGAIPGIGGRPGGIGVGMGNIACGPIGSGGCGIIPIAAGGHVPSNGSDDGITMMIAVLLASLFTNGQPQPFLATLVLPLQQQSPLLPHSHLLSLQQVQFAPHFFALQQQSLLSLQQQSPSLLHSHLLSLQQVPLASHFLPVQQDAPSLQHFPSLQHAPVAQQPLALQHFTGRLTAGGT